MTDSGILERDLAGIAAAVRSDETDARALAFESLERIRDRNPALNAVVRLAEEPQFGDPDGSLAGVPYLLKDLQTDAAGLPLTRGSRAWDEDPPPPGDSTLVRRIRAAGLTVLGRTNTPELGLNLTTEPRRYGPTRNPWNLGRSAGGSSGGAAAAVAGGLVPAAHATDSGGSTRIPAAWCGLVGFKPSRGLVPAGPHRLDDWQGMSHEHAVTRSVADTHLLFNATRGPEPGEWQPCPALQPESATLLRVGVMLDGPEGVPVAPAWRRAAQHCADVLSDGGHAVSLLEAPPESAEIGPLFGRVVAAHLAALARRPEVDEQRLEPALLELMDRGHRTSAAEFVESIAQLHALGVVLGRRWNPFDIMLSPTTAQPAPPIGQFGTDGPVGALFADLFTVSPFVACFNVTGGPGLSLPWGLDPDDMPLGVHLGAAPGRDLDVLALAASLELFEPGLTRLRPPTWPTSPSATPSDFL